MKQLKNEWLQLMKKAPPGTVVLVLCNRREEVENLKLLLDCWPGIKCVVRVLSSNLEPPPEGCSAIFMTDDLELWQATALCCYFLAEAKWRGIYVSYTPVVTLKGFEHLHWAVSDGQRFEILIEKLFKDEEATVAAIKAMNQVVAAITSKKAKAK